MKKNEYGMRKIILDTFRTKVARHPGMEGMSTEEEGGGSYGRSIRFRRTLKGRFDSCRILMSLNVFEQENSLIRLMGKSCFPFHPLNEL